MITQYGNTNPLLYMEDLLIDNINTMYVLT